MIMLAIGLLLWMALHLMKRTAPAIHGKIYERANGKGFLVMAAFMAISIILMIIGYRSADYIAIYSPPAWHQHMAMSLGVIAMTLLGVGHSKSRLKAYLRHPMLLAVILWAIAHLMVNGDLASLILFGGMLIWAIIEILIINRQEGTWQKPSRENLSLKGDLRLIAIGLVLSFIIIAIHIWGFGLIR